MRDITLIKKEIGKRLQTSRKAKGITQERLSEKIGIETQSYSNIERGIRLFSVEVLLKLLEELDVSADYILTGKHSEKTPILEALQRLNPNDTARVERIILLFQETTDEK